MELRFTRNSVLDTVLRDAQGKPLYRIESPFKVMDRRTILSRILPNPSRSSPHDDDDRTGRAKDDVRPDNASDTDILLAGMEERVVGEILWQDWKQSVFKFDGKERKLKDYFPGDGLLARNRSFVAMDGKQYKWTVGLSGCWMKRNDNSSEILVKYHMRSFGILGKARNRYLEISEDVQPILDEVLLTFIWLERRREQGDQPSLQIVG